MHISSYRSFLRGVGGRTPILRHVGKTVVDEKSDHVGSVGLTVAFDETFAYRSFIQLHQNVIAQP